MPFFFNWRRRSRFHEQFYDDPYAALIYEYVQYAHYNKTQMAYTPRTEHRDFIAEKHLIYLTSQ